MEYRPPTHKCLAGKFMKRKYYAPENKPIYICKKVWREDGSRVEEWRSEDLWKDTFNRRENNLSTGFFSPFGVTYRPTGEIILDTRDLIMHTLENPLATKKFQMHSYIIEKEQDVMPPVEDTSHLSESLDTQVIDVHSKAGYEKILQAIKRSNERVRSVKAGKIYDGTLVEHEKRMETPENEMVIVSIHDLDLLGMQQPTVQVPETESAIAAETSAEVAPNEEEVIQNILQSSHDLGLPSIVSGLTTSMSTLLPVLSPISSSLSAGPSRQFAAAQDLMALTKERVKRDQMSYLENIYEIIMFLRSVSNKSLKTRKPLSRQLLRELRKYQSSRFTQIRFSKMQSHRLSVIDVSMLLGENGKTGHCLQARRDRKVSSSRERICLKDLPQQTKVETWDDLVAASPCDDSLFSKTPQKLTVHSAIAELGEEKSLPIWLKVAAEKTSSVVNKGKQNADDKLKITEKAQMNFQKIKQNEEREVDNELSRLERERFMKFKVKLDCFDQLTSGELLEHRQRKMEKRANFITSCPDVEIPPSKWFEELKERTISITGSSDPDINRLLSKVGCYSAMSPKTVTYVKAKLCILVMSLPAYELLQIPMQQALKFVMEKILLGEPKQLIHWINSRKLPYVLIVN